MMISLYRMNGSERDTQLIYEHSGTVLIQATITGRANAAGGARRSSLGPAGSRATDCALARRLEELAMLGYRVLYGFIPPGTLPETTRFLSERLGIETIPDRRDGLPVWQTSSKGRGRRPAYLLFTALSSEAK